MSSLAERTGKQTLRVVLLVAIVLASGVGLGLAAGYPVSRIEFNEDDAIRLDHSRLAGEIDPAAALVTQADLELGWEAGDPALSLFGILGSDFCGKRIPLPTTLSEMQSAVFSNPNDGSILITQAVRVDRWQSARGYVDDLGDAVSECEQFYRTDAEGNRQEVTILEGTEDAPITDHVARTFRFVDGSSTQTWSVMAVGDVILGIVYSGPSRPRQGFISGLEQELLMRLDPKDFAPGGVPVSTETSTTLAPAEGADTTTTTVLEGGAADESEAPD